MFHVLERLHHSVICRGLIFVYARPLRDLQISLGVLLLQDFFDLVGDKLEQGGVHSVLDRVIFGFYAVNLEIAELTRIITDLPFDRLVVVIL